MRLAQAAQRFACTAVDVFDGHRWLARAISARVKPRSEPTGNPGDDSLDSNYFVTPQPLPAGAESLRFAGQVFLIVDAIEDFSARGHAVRYALLSLRTAGRCDVIHRKTSPRASGAAGTAEDVIVGSGDAALFGDTVNQSGQYDQVLLPVFDIWLPARLAEFVDRGSALELDGRRYNVQAAFAKARALRVRATQTGRAA